MMNKIFVLFFASLVSIFPLVSSCGPGHEEEVVGNSIMGFGFFGGIVSTLVIIALVLVIVLMSKNMKMKGGSENE